MPTGKSTRPSPTESATWYMPGTYKKGNDGNMYTIQVTAGGVHRWIYANLTSLPIEIRSPRHPGYNPKIGRAHV